MSLRNAQKATKAYLRSTLPVSTLLGVRRRGQEVGGLSGTPVTSMMYKMEKEALTNERVPHCEASHLPPHFQYFSSTFKAQDTR